MTTPTIAFAGIGCLNIDVQAQIATGFVSVTNVGPITSKDAMPIAAGKNK